MNKAVVVITKIVALCLMATALIFAIALDRKGGQVVMVLAALCDVGIALAGVLLFGAAMYGGATVQRKNKPQQPATVPGLLCQEHWKQRKMVGARFVCKTHTVPLCAACADIHSGRGCAIYSEEGYLKHGTPNAAAAEQ